MGLKRTSGLASCGNSENSLGLEAEFEEGGAAELGGGVACLRAGQVDVLDVSCGLWVPWCWPCPVWSGVVLVP